MKIIIQDNAINTNAINEISKISKISPSLFGFRIHISGRRSPMLVISRDSRDKIRSEKELEILRNELINYWNTPDDECLKNIPKIEFK